MPKPLRSSRVGAIGRRWPVSCAVLVAGWLGSASCQNAAHERIVVSSQDCVHCHRDDFLRAEQPPHVGELPQTCGDCHGDRSWAPAHGFEHGFFPLEAKHDGLACSSCHSEGFGPGDISPRCVSCHRDDYEGSPFPGHDQFPTTCRDCHSTAGWKPASGGLHPEGAFPIGSGKHSGYECSDCHNAELGPNGAGNADCVGCHESKHTRAKMDEAHHEVRDYPSGAAAPNFCLDCHPDGRKKDD